MIYEKFLCTSLTKDESIQVEQIDHDMLINEFNSLMKKKVFNKKPVMHSNPIFSDTGFINVENEFVNLYNKLYKIMFMLSKE